MHLAKSSAVLQFGHGGDAVGDAAARGVPGGDLALQFGHGGDAVGDVPATPVLAAGNAPLQFGHGGDAVGDPVLKSTGRGRLSRFNSATAVTPWVTSVPTTR